MEETFRELARRFDEAGLAEGGGGAVDAGPPVGCCARLFGVGMQPPQKPKQSYSNPMQDEDDDGRHTYSY